MAAPAGAGRLLHSATEPRNCGHLGPVEFTGAGCPHILAEQAAKSAYLRRRDSMHSATPDTPQVPAPDLPTLCTPARVVIGPSPPLEGSTPSPCYRGFFQIPSWRLPNSSASDMRVPEDK